MRDIILNELEFIWNYKDTQIRDGDGKWTCYNMSLSGITHRQRLLFDQTEIKKGKTYSEIKQIEARSITIRPTDYLELLKKVGHSKEVTHEELANSPSTDKIVEELRNGGKIENIPFIELDYMGREKDQEGRHRAEAASIIGRAYIPVIILSSSEYSSKKLDKLLNKFAISDITDYYRRLATKHHDDPVYNSLYSRLNVILNAWDEKRHPRDAKGRFTFVLKGSDFGKDALGDMVISKSSTKSLRDKLKSSVTTREQAEQLAGEAKSVSEYQNNGYKYINDTLRCGFGLEDAGAEDLLDACRFSLDKEIIVERGESSFSNNWSGTKVGSTADDFSMAFISTSTDPKVAEHFATKEREADPNGYSKIYETHVSIKIPPTQNFCIPQVYTNSDLNGAENEILLPPYLKYEAKSFKEESKTVGNRTVIEQRVELEII